MVKPKMVKHSFVSLFLCSFFSSVSSNICSFSQQDFIEDPQPVSNGVRLTKNPLGQSGTMAQGAIHCTLLTLLEPFLTRLADTVVPMRLATALVHLSSFHHILASGRQK